jgi:hypothetical protein
VALIGVPSKAKSATSLARGSLARVIWYLIERACFSEGVVRLAWAGLVWQAVGHDDDA